MKFGAPFYYDYTNSVVGTINPSTIHAKDNNLTEYFRRYLLKRALSIFKWTLPEGWNTNYFLYVLYTWGFIGVVNTVKFGTICQQCGLQGYNVYYQPTKVIISNPLIQSTIDAEIGFNASVIKLQPDYTGIMDIVAYYADKMALAAQSIDVNLINSKMAYVFAAKDKSAAESFKKLYDEISSGNPASFADTKLMGDDGRPSWQLITNNLKANYIAGEILADLRTIQNDFDSHIGIPNANTTKRERMLTDEVNANNIETRALCDLWLDTLQEGIDETNRIFGTNIKVEWRYDPDGNTVNPGTIQVQPQSV